MEFQSGSGASRGRNSTSGGFRGRGGSGRGATLRVQGRGRGGFRAGRVKPVFDSARVAEQKERNAEALDEDSSSATTDEDELQSEEPSSEEEDAERRPTVQPYTVLLQSLAGDAHLSVKKRKLGNAPDEKSYSVSEYHKKTDLGERDKVQEPEEGSEASIDEKLGEEEENEQDLTDPFETHFANPPEDVLIPRLQALEKNQWCTVKRIVPKIGLKMVLSTPVESKSTNSWFLPTVSGPEGLSLKQKLAVAMERERPKFDLLEENIAPAIFNYHDVLYCERNTENSESLRRLTCLHAVNHIFKTRDRVIKNNSRLAKEDQNHDLDLRDQGFTRPKVLVLLPTRESCVRMVNMITAICEPEQQENRKRFDDSYVVKEEKFSSDKAEDFRELFSGNDDDMFRLGIKFTRKTIKYFSQFYNSDIIFASPLGLRMAIGTDEDHKIDHGFLSSIEIVIVDQADALLMQNWEHVEFIFEHLNLQPKETHGCDFSRVRNWYLDNNAKHFRQTIALCAFNTPESNTLFFSNSKNWAGRIKISAKYPGALQELGMKVKQTFSRLESPKFSTDPDIRFTYFTTVIIPALTRHSKDSAGTLIFIPSYLDFVRVRNYFITSVTTSSLSFGIVSEYTSVTEVARARSHFLTGRHKVLLYTERAHHFRRYLMRGVRKVIMYGLPDNPIFYEEIVGGYLGRSFQEGRLEPGQGSVRVVFSKWDVLKLERVAGTERVGKMIMEKGDTFDFV